MTPRFRFSDFRRNYWRTVSLYHTGQAPITSIFKQLGEHLLVKRVVDFNFDLASLTSLLSDKKRQIIELNLLMAKQSDPQRLLQPESSFDTTPFLSRKLPHNNIDLSCRRFKLVGFQNCRSVDDVLDDSVGSTQYRAPELILSSPQS